MGHPISSAQLGAPAFQLGATGNAGNRLRRRILGNVRISMAPLHGPLTRVGGAFETLRLGLPRLVIMTSTVPSMICPTLAVQENQMFHEPSLSGLFGNCQSTVGARSDHHSSSQPEAYENDLKRTKTVRTVVHSGIVDAHQSSPHDALHCTHNTVRYLGFLDWPLFFARNYIGHPDHLKCSRTNGPRTTIGRALLLVVALGSAVSIDTRKTQVRSDIEDLSPALRAPSALASKTHKCYTP
jgi:hypothetical protein